MYKNSNHYKNYDIFIKKSQERPTYLQNQRFNDEILMNSSFVQNPYLSSSVQFLQNKDKDIIQKLSKINNQTTIDSFKKIINQLKDKSILYKKLYTTSTDYSTNPDINQDFSIFEKIINKKPDLLKTLKKNDRDFYEHLDQATFLEAVNYLIINSKKQNTNSDNLELIFKKIHNSFDYDKIQKKSHDSQYQNNKLNQLELLKNLVCFVQPLQFNDSTKEKYNNIQNYSISDYSNKMNDNQYNKLKKLTDHIKPMVSSLDIVYIDYALKKYINCEQLKDFVRQFNIETNKENMASSQFVLDNHKKTINVDKINCFYELGVNIHLSDQNSFQSISEKSPQLLNNLLKQDINLKDSPNILNYSSNILEQNPNNQLIRNLYQIMQNNLVADTINQNLDNEFNNYQNELSHKKTKLKI